MTKNDRARRVHRLIGLGGLIEKAGLGLESPAVILGLLSAAFAALGGPRGEEYRAAWRARGEKSFTAGKPTGE